MTNDASRPVALSVFPGNAGDASTLLPQVVKHRQRFGLASFTLVGDRSMITAKHLEVLKEAGVDWATALKSQSLKELVVDGVIQPSLFDEENLAEMTHAGYPGERLIAFRNPVLGRLQGKVKIRLRFGEKLAKYRMAKHFKPTIEDNAFAFEVDREGVAAEAVRTYKDPSKVERAWASLTFKDEEANHERDPVAPAERSAAARKAQTNTLDDGTPAPPSRRRSTCRRTSPIRQKPAPREASNSRAGRENYTPTNRNFSLGTIVGPGDLWGYLGSLTQIVPATTK